MPRKMENINKARSEPNMDEYFSTRRKKFSFFSSSHSSSRFSVYGLISSACIVTLFQIHILLFSRPQPNASPITFLPLKDLRFAATPMDGNTWFMSALNDTHEAGEAEHLLFPSDASHHKLLCLAGRDRSNGTRNSYALAPRGSLPDGAKLLKGMSFVSDSYYDYENLWHGLSAVVPFMAWHGRKRCEKPERWVLYHRGELRVQMSPWVSRLLEAVLDEEPRIEDYAEAGEGPYCFEKAVAFRHNEGEMKGETKEMVYDMMRCKSRVSCGLRSGGGGGEGVVRVTLLLRTGARSFKDEKGVLNVFHSECRKVERCRLTVARSDNLTFCDQVKLMTETDILASPHGAQLTNMFLMDRNSSVMEFFPKGWKQLAGAGQFVFRWIAIAAGIRHQGAWHDPIGDPCPYADNSRCFAFYKNGRIGHDDAYLTNWTSRVIRDTRDYKLTEVYRKAQQRLRTETCLCSATEGRRS